MEKIYLSLPQFGVMLSTEPSNVPGLKKINLPELDTRESLDLLHQPYSCFVDERTNLIEFITSSGASVFDPRLSKSTSIDYILVDFLKNSYEKLRNSDFRFSPPPGIEGKSITVGMFFDWIKQNNRDEKIESILI